MTGRSGPTLDLLAPLFERLRVLPLDMRDAELAALPIDDAQRTHLKRLLDADAADGDPLAEAIAGGARRLARPREDRLGAWRLVREIGAGGMGTVFLAERADGQFAQQVAIKLLRGFPTEEAKRRLRQERQILADLDHPNIARLIDGGETVEGQPWLALEYVDGMPLIAWIAEYAVARNERLALFDAMLDAVAHAHRHLIVHRDIKPGNAIVTRDGTVKLLDFGIARLVESGEDSRETSTRVFSLGYASPEQIEGRAITTASDIYTLGVLLREMLTGRRDAARDERPPVVPPLPLDADLAGIIGKATDMDPQRRYAGAVEFRDDLVRCREGRPVRAARWTRTYRLRKFAGRHRVGFGVALAAVLVLLGFVWRLERERTRAVSAEVAGQRALTASERDAASARASLGFLSNAFAAASPQRALSRDVSVRSLLDAARAELDAHADPALKQTMQRLLAHLYSDLGETATALALMRDGTAGVEPHDRAEALRFAGDYDTYASLEGGMGDGDAARTAAKTAAAWRAKFAPDDAVERVRSLEALSLAEHLGGDDDKATALGREAMTAIKAQPNAPLDLYAGVAESLATLLARGGDGKAALAIADEALVRVDAARPAESPEHVMLLDAKAIAMRADGDSAGAEKLLREAMALQDRVVASGGAQMMEMTNDLALALNDLGRYREAAELLRESDRHMLGAGIDGAPDRAVSHSNLAAVLENAGDCDGALAELALAREVLDAGHVDADHGVRRQIERNEARSLGFAGQHARALAQLTALRARAARLDGEDSGEYASVTWQLVVLTRLMHQPATGLPLLADAERRWHALVPDDHPIFLHIRRVRAAFAIDKGDFATAERELRAAVAGFESGGALPVDLAIAESELAAVRARQGARAEARDLLARALPALRESLLPTQVNRAAAEQTMTALDGRHGGAG
jgi:eukaryotic-like serine/threonine-protein kinase